MATHSIILAWEISWTEKPGRLQSMGAAESQTQRKLLTQRVRAKMSTVFTQANQGCVVLAVNAIGICTGLSKC